MRFCSNVIRTNRAIDNKYLLARPSFPYHIQCDGKPHLCNDNGWNFLSRTTFIRTANGGSWKLIRRYVVGTGRGCAFTALGPQRPFTLSFFPPSFLSLRQSTFSLPLVEWMTRLSILQTDWASFPTDLSSRPSPFLCIPMLDNSQWPFYLDRGPSHPQLRRTEDSDRVDHRLL